MKSLRFLVGCWGIIGLGIAIEPVAEARQFEFSLATPQGQAVAVEPGNAPATVVCFLGTQCPMARAYALKLNQLQSDFARQGVRVVGVMSNHQDSVEDVVKYCTELDVAFPIVRDEMNKIADRYGASRTPEVFLLDQSLKLRYHGRIDDQLSPGITRPVASRPDLAIAIGEVLGNKPVSIPETRVLGCILGRAPVQSTSEKPGEGVTYSMEVARVLQKHCIECHRDGEIGPFAMDSYEEVVGWAATMLETIDNGRMPPWHADPQFGHFSNERIMPAADKEILRSWIAGGMQRGDAAQLPPDQEYVAGWSLPREPDLVVSMRARPFTVPKDGVVEYQYFVADPGLKEDTWVSAAQVIPGSRSVVHHAIVFVRPPDGSEFNGIGWLSAYVPGQRVHALPPGRARKIPAGSKLVFQMHYTPNGMEQQDVTKVGLIICDRKDVTDEVFTMMAIDQEFEIPPGESDFVVRAETQRLPPQAELLAITPHMHFRGKSFTLFSQANAQKLLSVPRYDFNWQHTYQLAEPLPLEELQGLKFEAVFDNSSENPFNPDATQTVTWGDQSWEEMAVAFFEVSRPLTSQSSAKSAAAQHSTEAGTSRDNQLELREQYVKRVLSQLDADGDGEIKKAEADIVVRHMHFRLWDLDGDNIATTKEVRQVAERLFR